MAQGEPREPTVKIADVTNVNEQERCRIGATLHEALYNRIYDPENELTDTEEKTLDGVVARVEREGIDAVTAKIAALYRRYERHKINKFRLRWFAGGINWVDVVKGKLPPRVIDKINAYYKGYLSPVVEQGKLKRLFDSLDIRVADAILERTLEALFPSLRGLEKEERRIELERLTNTASNQEIDGYIDNPATQKRYNGLENPEQVFHSKETLAEFCNVILIAKSGYYFSPIFTEKIIALVTILQREVSKKRELDMLDSSIARILVLCIQEELARSIVYHKAKAEGPSDEKSEKEVALLQLHLLESFSERLAFVFQGSRHVQDN